jgi:hypothetical protein
MALERAIRYAAVLGALGSFSAANAQETCRPPDATSTALLSELSKRNRPELRTADIELISDESLCRRAAQAYQAALPANSRGLSGQVHLVRLGKGFAVLDPAYYGPRPGVWTVVLLDSRMRVLGVL